MFATVLLFIPSISAAFSCVHSYSSIRVFIPLAFAIGFKSSLCIFSINVFSFFFFSSFFLKITEVEPNRDQPRKNFDQEALEELAASIKEYGLIQPIVVTKKDGYYGIVAGERRWRASKIEGLKEIQAIIREDNKRIN